ncbi:hypothetical protein YIM73518_24200 [Thermus brockianus]
MEKLSTNLQVLSRQRAVSHAAYQIADARERLAQLYSWAISGGQDYVSLLIAARDVVESLQRVFALASAFAYVSDDYTEDINAFFEEARLEAGQIVAWRESQKKGEEVA